ncbi:CENP-S associating centromere protein X-domain-containing protein [Xylariales sp. PMI_506]|nr:CENP-S associating centromere protein X-domain-containing protein [Xylariales sp. PMI_506]
MPPNQSNSASRGRGRPPGSTIGPRTSTGGVAKQRSSTSTTNRATRPSKDADHDPFEDSQEAIDVSIPVSHDGDDQEDEEEEEKKTIPPELLTRLLHEFFEKDGTRISKGANEAVAKYMDIFVREAIARAVVEKEAGFLEVSDLEKVAAQLLLDF